GSGFESRAAHDECASDLVRIRRDKKLFPAPPVWESGWKHLETPAPAHVGAFVIRGSWGMSRRKFPIALIAAALAVTSVILASPAGAVVDSCATAGSGGISMFPNTPSGQSNLKVSCTLTTAR